MSYHLHLLSLSASEHSVSRACLDTVKNVLTAEEIIVSQSDIRELPPVWVNGSAPEEYSPKYAELAKELARADGYILFLPVHCYSMASTAKVVTEILFTPLKRKPMAFVTAGGSGRSLLAIRDLMTSLIFDSEALIFPKQVFLTQGDLDEKFSPKDDLSRRLETLARDFAKFVRAVKPLSPNELVGARGK